MVENNIKNLTLQKYLDMSYINTILCQYHHDFYYKINMVVMFPAILGSCFLTILNSSSMAEDILKWFNISINGLNTIIITLSTQYKLNDRLSVYKNCNNKYNKLCHKIESIINNSNDITDKILDDIINEYDTITNDNPYGFLSSYKKKIINVFGGKRELPNSLKLDYETSTNASLVITNV